MGSFSNLTNLAILVAVTTCILMCSSAIICESHLRFVARFPGQDEGGNHSFADEVCSTWELWMGRLLSRVLPEDPSSISRERKSSGLFLFGVAFPFFLTSTIVYGLSLFQRRKKSLNKKESSPNARDKYKGSKLGLGDPPIHWWSFLVLFLPTGLIFADVVLHAPDNSRMNNMSFLMHYGMLLANPFGVAACISLSFFLVPVARGSYTIEWETDNNGFGWSWSPMHALVFHRWAGWAGALFTGLHAAVFCSLYIKSGKYSHQSPLQALWSKLVPGRECWPSWLPWSPGHSSDDSFVGCFRRHSLLQNSGNMTIEDCFDAESQKNVTMGGQCYGHWRNFMGTISALAFLVLCLTSISFVRRNFYSLFYKTHIVAGSMMLIFAVLHFETILMYLFPSMVYYLATTIPTLVHQYRSRKNNGVRIERVEHVKDSGGCVEVTMPMSSTQHMCFPDSGDNNFAINFSSLSTPVYARICVPHISIIWHPFSVMIKPKNIRRLDKSPSSISIASQTTDPLLIEQNIDGDSQNEHMAEDVYEVVICFRPVGPFTKAWANSLVSAVAQETDESGENMISNPKTLLLDGLYPGAFPIPKILQRHDTLVLVAGGVGIVPFVSVLQAWFHFRKHYYKKERQLRVESEQEDGNPSLLHHHDIPRKIVLYWSCREPGLVNHFLKHHLNFLWVSDNTIPLEQSDESDHPCIQIFCHLTRGGSGRASMLRSDEHSTLREPLLTEESRIPYRLPSSSLTQSICEDEEGGKITSLSETSGTLSCESSTSLTSSSGEVSRCDQQHSSTADSLQGRGLVRVARFDWMSFGVFALILWFNFLVQMWQYNRHVIVQDSSTSVRFNSIYIALVWSVLVASFGEFFRAWHSRKHTSQESTHIEANRQCSMRNSEVQMQEEQVSSLSSNGNMSTHVGVESFGSIAGENPDDNASTSFDHRSALLGMVSVSIVSGRPDFEDIVDPIGNSDSPAILLCGPEKLRESIRRVIRTNHKCRKKCSIYEEVSEM